MRNYSDKLVPQIERLIERCDPGEKDRVEFELMFAFGQTNPNMPPGFHALLVMTMPSPIIGQSHLSLTQFTPVGVSDEALERFVREAIENLRAERSKALDDVNAKVNGSPG